ncbi:MAG: DinB family protein [Acidobacteria bacterium]|nr:DinB family protein [Acidobacteriota bacterium]MBK9963862.1 DinB family protein [Holophagales bacterium]
MAAGSPGPVVPDRYLEALGGDDPVAAMAEAPDLLRRLVRGLSEKQLATKPAPGKWSIREIVAHLADNEVILGSRYRFIAAMDRPPLPGFDQDAFVANLGVNRATAADLLDDFAMARAVNIGLLERVGDAAWDRVGIHAERGEESLGRLVTMYAGHDRIHLVQVETIRTGLFPKAGRAARGKSVAKKRPAKKSSAKAKRR